MASGGKIQISRNISSSFLLYGPDHSNSINFLTCRTRPNGGISSSSSSGASSPAPTTSSSPIRSRIRPFRPSLLRNRGSLRLTTTKPTTTTTTTTRPTPGDRSVQLAQSRMLWQKTQAFLLGRKNSQLKSSLSRKKSAHLLGKLYKKHRFIAFKALS